MRNSGAAAVADSFAGGSWPPRSPRRTRKRVAAVVGRLLEKGEGRMEMELLAWILIWLHMLAELSI